MRWLVWASLSLIGYTYVGFPVLLLVRARLWPRPMLEGRSQPRVTVIIAAHNEEAAIGRKLQSVLASDYPHHRLEVIVASDGSTDATAAIVDGLRASGVRLLDLPRVGKAAAMNAAIAESTGEVLVLTDANSILAPDAIAELVRPFADPRIGGVAGDQRYSPPERAGDPAAGERSYWDLDRVLKRAESAAGNVVSATGALYAIRRHLVGSVPEGVTDDFALSTAVIEAGFRLVFGDRAVAIEPPADSTAEEWGRKVRVATRGLRGVLLRRRLLDPRRHGFYAVQLWSHKVLRRVMFAPLVALALAAAGAWRYGWFYRLLAVGQAQLYAMAAAGLVLGARGRRVPRALALPAFFVMVNAASFVAVVNVITGRRMHRWEPRRTLDSRKESEEVTPVTPSLDKLRSDLRHVLPTAVEQPAASIIVPVNARGDLNNVLRLLWDISRYDGEHRFDVVLVLNNYPDGQPPAAARALRSLGLTLLEIPTVARPAGQVIPLSARIPGIAAARSDWAILFDADCRVPDPRPLLDWYVQRGRMGDGAAYTRVAYSDLRPGGSVRARMWAHHASRWVKRVVLGIPTTRGSNYAVSRPIFTALHAAGYVADEMNVGPAIRKTGARVTYSGDRRHTVLTSGRMFRGGWGKLVRYLRYRLAYNMRVLPVAPNAASRTHRETDPADRFDYDARMEDAP